MVPRLARHRLSTIMCCPSWHGTFLKHWVGQDLGHGKILHFRSDIHIYGSCDVPSGWALHLVCIALMDMF